MIKQKGTSHRMEKKGRGLGYVQFDRMFFDKTSTYSNYLNNEQEYKYIYIEIYREREMDDKDKNRYSLGYERKHSIKKTDYHQILSNSFNNL